MEWGVMPLSIESDALHIESGAPSNSDAPRSTIESDSRP